MRKKQRVNEVFLLSLLFLFCLWWWVTRVPLIDPLFLPSPEQVWLAAIDLFVHQQFLFDIGISVFRVFSAFLLAFVFAVPLALFMTEFAFVKRLLEPYIDFIRYLPVPALIPLTILFFGLGEESKIALLFIGTFFQLILLIIDDIYTIPTRYFDLSFSLGFSPMRVRLLKLRAILPELYNNSRITLGWAWTYLVIAELVAAQAGIGHVIKEAQRFSNTEKVYVAIVTLGVIGLVIDQAFKRLYPVFFPYKKYD